MTSSDDASAMDVEWLSYDLRPDTPAYGGARGLQLTRLTSLAAGDTANTLLMSLPNHIGTHVDVPAHFFNGARTLLDYAPGDWVFDRPCLVDVDVGAADLVERDHVEEHVSTDADLLLIRTGHGERRGTPSYWEGGPGLAPELGTWLREFRPLVRAVGMDLISVTSRANREIGRQAHRAFLDPDRFGDPVRLIEDMKLDRCPMSLDWVLVSPLPVEGADGAPVTVWGFTSARRSSS